MGFSRTKVSVLVLVTVALLFGSTGVASAGREDLATAWSWAQTSAFCDAHGAPATFTKVPDPTGQRQGLVLTTAFSTWGWGFLCTNGPELFHFEHGKDYTLLFDVYAAPGCYGAASVEVFSDNCGRCLPVTWCATDVTVVGDASWHTVPVWLEDFCGPDGDYYLMLRDQANAGCWLIGDIRTTCGTGHFAK